MKILVRMENILFIVKLSSDKVLFKKYALYTSLTCLNDNDKV